MAAFCAVLAPRATREKDLAAFREIAAALRGALRAAARATLEVERQTREAIANTTTEVEKRNELDRK